MFKYALLGLLGLVALLTGCMTPEQEPSKTWEEHLQEARERRAAMSDEQKARTDAERASRYPQRRSNAASRFADEFDRMRREIQADPYGKPTCATLRRVESLIPEAYEFARKRRSPDSDDLALFRQMNQNVRTLVRTGYCRQAL